MQLLRNCWVRPHLSLDVVQFCVLIPYICILCSPFLRLFGFALQFIALLKQDDASLNFPLKRSAEELNHSKPKKLPRKMVPTENGQQEFFKVINSMRQGIIFSVGKTPHSWYPNKILNHLRTFLLSFDQKLGRWQTSAELRVKKRDISVSLCGDRKRLPSTDLTNSPFSSTPTQEVLVRLFPV